MLLGIGISVSSSSSGVLFPPAGYIFLTETDGSGAIYYLTETVGGSTFYLMEAE